MRPGGRALGLAAILVYALCEQQASKCWRTVKPDACCRASSPADLLAGSSPFRKNILLGRLLDADLLIPAVPPRREGRIAIVTNVGCGMRWTRWRRMTGAAEADGEVVWA